MKAFIVYFLLCIGCISRSVGQKDINLVLSIDDKVLLGRMSNLEIEAIKNDNTKDFFGVSYSPGNLTISDSISEKILSPEVKCLVLSFNYLELCKNDHKAYNYKIEFKQSWLKNYYTVINIYNTNKRKNKNIYIPLPNLTYTYEVFYPGGAMTRVKKKLLKDDCLD